MKKWQIILVLITISYVSYYMSYYMLRYIGIDEKTNAIISFIIWILPTLTYILIIKKIIKKEDEIVINNSKKIHELIKLNEKYDFKKITKRKHYITEREYSRKSLDRVTAIDIIKYHLDNNIDFLRDDIENSIHNIKVLEEYTKDIEKIEKYESTNDTKFSDKKFKKIEKRVFELLSHHKKDFLITLKLHVYYQSNGGRVNEDRYGKRSYDELLNIYHQWKNGKKYEATAKQERKIMNDDIRYNVLKRDNYTCQICGITAKDGAKLHVDHIKPVSKGGKTVMSNLQTLCERCNLGKSNKTDEVLEDNQICPKCGNKLIEKTGKYGKFLGCTNYPKCKYTRNI